MSYQLNSARDSRGDEHLFVKRFNANRAAIEAYKRQRGGDWERAFQAVTGTPWPAGRSVKISNGRAEMTKDRTVKSVLGKYVAPIAAGVVAPFALPAFAAGGAAAGATAGAGAAAGGAGAAGAAGSIGAWTLGSTAVAGGLDLFGSLFRARASDRSAKLQTEAMDRATAAQEGAAAEALAFQREESRRARISEEAARRGNYDWDAARERRIGTIGEMVGLGRREIPAYVPLGGEEGESAASNVDLSGAQQAFNSLFPDETLTPAMLKAREADLKAAGFTLRPNAKGVVGKVQYQGGPIIDVIQGADSGVNKRQWLLPQNVSATPVARRLYDPGTVGAFMAPSLPARRRVRTAPLEAPNTIREYAVGRY